MIIIPRPFLKSRDPKTIYVIVNVKGQRRKTTRINICLPRGDFLFRRGESRVAAVPVHEPIRISYTPAQCRGAHIDLPRTFPFL